MMQLISVQSATISSVAPEWATMIMQAAQTRPCSSAPKPCRRRSPASRPILLARRRSRSSHRPVRVDPIRPTLQIASAIGEQQCENTCHTNRRPHRLRTRRSGASVSADRSCASSTRAPVSPLIGVRPIRARSDARDGWSDFAAMSCLLPTFPRYRQWVMIW